MKKVKYVCRECNSDNVSVDAFVDWNEETQAWDLIRATYDEANCHECGDSTKLNEVPLETSNVRVSNQESNNTVDVLQHRGS